MDTPQLIPVDPRPGRAAPSAPASCAGQAALALLLVLLAGLLAHRGYGGRLGTRPTEAATGPPARRLDLNASDHKALEQVPGIGPKMALAIEEHRRANGPFRDVADLRTVHGFGPATLDKVRPFVHADAPPEEPPPAEPLVLTRKPAAPQPSVTRSVSRKITADDPPVDLNAASIEELQRLPKVGPTLAHRIVEYRGRARFQSADDLRKVSGIGSKKTFEAIRPFVTAK